MNRKNIYPFATAFILLTTILFIRCTNKDESNFDGRVKIALREVGNRLLLSSQDSTSVIKPIIQLEKSKFQLTFESDLFFEPNKLVQIADSTLNRSKLPETYLVEVIRCSDNEVAYSYQMSNAVDDTIIPCNGRYVPAACYLIEIQFLKEKGKDKPFFWIYLLAGIMSLLLAWFLLKGKNSQKAHTPSTKAYTPVGHFQFYPDQNILIREALEINLSKKECELLEIFVSKPNQVIKRSELMKQVWEDNGVVVGRSLDTYISKLRKKLSDDTSIKISNIHGVGYKLEIEAN